MSLKYLLYDGFIDRKVAGLEQKMGTMTLSTNSTSSDEKLECEDCEKKFSGIESWEQHIKSQKHQKKVLLRVSLTKISSRSSVTLTSASSTSSVFECTICFISCNSQVSLEEHLKSKSHEKAVAASKNGVKTTFDVKSVPKLECIPCQKTFSGQESLEEHLKSSKHQKKVWPITPSESLKKDNVKTASAPVSTVVMSNGTKVDQQYDCNICQISCSGPESYKQHIESNKHKKKVAPEAAINGGQTTSSSGTFKCSICNIECSGEQNFKQHENSDKHKKKLLKL